MVRWSDVSVGRVKDRMWRKTRSRVANTRSRGCVGVDANRNFDFQWLCKSYPSVLLVGSFDL